MEAEGLSGEIPPCISNLTYLVSIHLPNNSLSGHILPELGRLSRLRYLNLSFNTLTGTIPFSIGTLHNLSSLDLGNNRLSGEISPPLGSSGALETICLPNNLLGGEIPQSLANSSSTLTALLLGQNQLQGFIPDFGKLSALEILDLSYNDLSGTVPHSIYNLSSLSVLGLANNNLRGTLPSDMGNTLHNIQILMMADNHFEGDIPATLQNASRMISIHLGNNYLTGVIPSFGSMPNLKYVMLYANQLEARDWTFFSSLANCTQLKNLNVDTNNILHGRKALRNGPTDRRILLGPKGAGGHNLCRCLVGWGAGCPARRGRYLLDNTRIDLHHQLCLPLSPPAMAHLMGDFLWLAREAQEGSLTDEADCVSVTAVGDGLEDITPEDGDRW
ncbi:putative LRR receptor-like serine/threonine-protein kinase [Hordeum vulgare]|nr:putative LRR receptor-like serine/threonine-protein kinase [Hordeum vulgare]